MQLKCNTEAEILFCIIYTEPLCRMAVSSPARLCHVALSHGYWFYRLADIFAVCRIYVSCYLILIKCLKLLLKSLIAIHFFPEAKYSRPFSQRHVRHHPWYPAGPGELSWATITQNYKYWLVLIILIFTRYGKSTHLFKLDMGAHCPIPSSY